MVRVQRHRCLSCRRAYSESSPWLVRGSWYAREVHRCAVDHWQHTGSSLRRTAEWLRSLLGHQERWGIWCLVQGGAPTCFLAASTVERWLDHAGRAAQESVAGQLRGVAISRQVGTDGLWVRLRGGAKRVVLAVVDYASGVMWPPVVVTAEECEESWQRLFERAREAGLLLNALRGLTSDGCWGLLACLRRNLVWVNHQRCVWHLWRSLGAALARGAAQAAMGLAGEAAKAAREAARQELVALVHGMLDASSHAQAELNLARLLAHPFGRELAASLGQQMDAALVHLLDYNRRLTRVAPEWYWRDFRLRLSRGRNHSSDRRLERAALVWAIYRNFTPAQWRSERKRHYRWPGQSPLAVAGTAIEGVSYLDALCI